jgi:hypothetical protein
MPDNADGGSAVVEQVQSDEIADPHRLRKALLHALRHRLIGGVVGQNRRQQHRHQQHCDTED